MKPTSAFVFALLLLPLSSPSAFGQSYWLGGSGEFSSTNWLPNFTGQGAIFSNEPTRRSGAPNVTNMNNMYLRDLGLLDVHAAVVNLNFNGSSFERLEHLRVGSTFGFSQLTLESIGTTITKSLWVGHDSDVGFGPAKLVIGNSANVLSSFGAPPALGSFTVFDNSNLVIDGGALSLKSATVPRAGFNRQWRSA